MKGILATCLLSWLVLSGLDTLALAAGLPVNPSNYRIVKADDTETAAVAWAEPHWLDNDRVLLRVADWQLSGIKVEGGRRSISKPRYTLHVWNTRTGQLTRYSAEELYGGICVADGFVRYRVKRGSNVIVKEGALGAEVERHPTPPRTSADKEQIYPIVNPYTCKEYWYADVPRPNAGGAYPLKDGDGVLEIKGSVGTGRPDSAAHFPPYKRWLHRGGISTELALPQKQFRGRPLYWGLISSYVYRWTPGQLEKGISNWFYAVDPHRGNVREIVIPGSEYWTYLAPTEATRAGIVAAASAINVYRSWDPGTSGLYLFHGREVQDFFGRSFLELQAKDGKIGYELLVGGLVRALATSPDGCGLVTKIDPYDHEGRSQALLLIGLCEKGR